MNIQGAGRKVRVLLATDEPVLALGAACLLSSAGDFELIRASAEVAEIPATLERERPDVLVIDVVPDCTPALFTAARTAAPDCRIVVWARSFSAEVTFPARQGEIAGVMRRQCSPEEFLRHLRAVASGLEVHEEIPPERMTTVQLTPRESQIISLLAQGLRNKEIANCLSLSEGTVKSYLVGLFRKVGARDRFELAILGLKNTYWGQADWDGPNQFVSGPEQERARPVLRSLVLVETPRRANFTGDLPRAAGE